MTWVWINGDFVEAEKASVRVSDLALQRGYGVFDFFRTRNHRPLFLEDYLDRFYQSASLAHLSPLVARDALRQVIYQLIETNNIPESGIKMILTGGYSNDAYSPAVPNLIIQQHPITVTGEEKFKKGIKIFSYPYQRELPQIKSIHYLMGVWLQPELAARGADDVLYQHDGLVLEFPRANVFMVTPTGTLVTPHRNILQGVTRAKLLETACKHMKVEERDIALAELFTATEVFLTSTTKRILPVFEIDGQPLSQQNDTTRFLWEAFLKMEEQEISGK